MSVTGCVTLLTEAVCSRLQADDQPAAASEGSWGPEPLLWLQCMSSGGCSGPLALQCAVEYEGPDLMLCLAV